MTREERLDNAAQALAKFHGYSAIIVIGIDAVKGEVAVGKAGVDPTTARAFIGGVMDTINLPIART